MPEVSWWRSFRERLELLPVEPSQVVAGLVLAVVLGVGGVAWAIGAVGRGSTSGPPVEAALPHASASSTSVPVPPAPAEVVVHMAGAVAKPGVYRLATGSRVADALAAAGGAATDADLDRLNLAALVADGERVYVPRRGEPEPATSTSTGSGGSRAPPGSPSSPVNLNTATVEQLEALPGVGPATARAIVDYRTRHGPFRTVRDLLKVRGIGEAKLAALEEWVRT